jgi:hypothetical protein
LNFHAFLGVFRFAKTPVRRMHAISPRGDAPPMIAPFKKSMLRQKVGPNLPTRLH